jgi:(2R)-sulfolactate sulfo-lyase subunit alpha
MISPLILLHPDDNVLVCRAAIPAGADVMIDDAPASIACAIEVGHKVARTDLKTGDKILKYGAPIGSMTFDARRGDHIHMHNMKSDYISSHTRKIVG